MLLLFKQLHLTKTSVSPLWWFFLGITVSLESSQHGVIFLNSSPDDDNTPVTLDSSQQLIDLWIDPYHTQPQRQISLRWSCQKGKWPKSSPLHKKQFTWTPPPPKLGEAKKLFFLSQKTENPRLLPLIWPPKFFSDKDFLDWARTPAPP